MSHSFFISQLRELYINNKLVPFIGAGLSIPFGLPNWRELISDYAKLFEIKGLASFQEMIQFELSNNDYWEALRAIKKYANRTDSDIQEFICKSIKDKINLQIDEESHNYSDLARMNFDIYLTTNYDHLLNKFLTSSYVPTNLKDFSGNTQNTLLNDGEKRIFHLHGNISQQGSVVITQETYSKLYNDKKYDQLFSLLTGTKTFIFLGFSFDDIFIQRILKDINQFFNTKHYILLDNPSKEQIEWLKSTYNIETISYNSNDSSHAGEIRSILKDIASEANLVEGENKILNDKINIQAQHNTKHEILKKIGTLKKSLNYENDIIQHESNNLSKALKLNSLSYMIRRLEKVEKILSVDKYDVVFIGEIGCGKTTAICNLFNLIKDIDIGENIHDLPLLPTSSGRTTLGEVRILGSQSSNVTIRIEPKDYKDVKHDIEQFCDFYWKKHKSKKNNKSDNQVQLDAELDRVIRNMAGFTSDEKFDEFTENFIGEKGDFNKTIEANINFKERNKTEIIYDEKTTKQSLKEWLKDITKKLNDGELDRFSIPQKTYIYIDKEILDLNKLKRINSIIDTKGMESVDRDDLESFIKSDNTLCIFLDRFNPAPSKLIYEFLVNSFKTTNSNSYLRSKVCMMVLPRKPEQLNMSGATGNEEKGTKIRKKQIENKFIEGNINFDIENLLFYDAYKHIRKDDEGLILTIAKPSIEDDRNNIFGNLNKIIEKRENNLMDQVILIENQLEILKRNNYLSDGDSKKIEKIHNEIKIKMDISPYELAEKTTERFLVEYKSFLESHYSSTLRAINNRFGIYYYRDINIYLRAANLIRGNLDYLISSTKKSIIDTMVKIEDNSSGLKVYLEHFEEQINIYYTELFEGITEEITSFLTSSVFAPQSYESDFWNFVISRWGNSDNAYKFVKYTDDILYMYNENLNKYKVKEEFNRIISEKWETFMDNVLKVSGVERVIEVH